MQLAAFGRAGVSPSAHTQLSSAVQPASSAYQGKYMLFCVPAGQPALILGLYCSGSSCSTLPGLPKLEDKPPWTKNLKGNGAGSAEPSTALPGSMAGDGGMAAPSCANLLPPPVACS